MAQLDYLAHLRENSARFLEVMRSAPDDAPVPTCPDWVTDDLIWHLGEVQWFWGTVVREDVSDPGSLEHPARPADRAGLLTFFEESSGALLGALTATAPEEPRWTWSADKTAWFIRRRQAHEALIHRIDAELTADVQRAPMDPAFSSDGVDEALRVMFGGKPAWGRFDPDPEATVRVVAEDTGRSWLVTLGAFTGSDPDGSASYDAEPDLLVAETDTGAEVTATIGGRAADLDCWLWGRPTVEALTRSGSEHVHSRLQDIVSQGVD